MTATLTAIDEDMTMRCRSWRPKADSPHHAKSCSPGECRACWRPCLARIKDPDVRESGTERPRCDECCRALVTHHDPAVRRAVAREDDLPLDMAQALSSDLDATVAKPAITRLEQLQHGQHHYTPEPQ